MRNCICDSTPPPGVVCQGTWADGMNIHGAHENVLVRDCNIRNTGDDTYAIWSVGVPGADNITFVNNVGVDPWYRPGGSSAPQGSRNTDNCFAANCTVKDKGGGRWYFRHVSDHHHLRLKICGSRVPLRFDLPAIWTHS